MIAKELKELAEQTDELFRVLDKFWSQCRAGALSKRGRADDSNGAQPR